MGGKRKPLKDLFYFVKSLGAFPEYETYEDYEKGKLGFGVSEEENKESFKKFKESLSKKEQGEFDYMFGKNETEEV